MTKLPPPLSSYQKLAEKYLAEGRVKDVIFSGPTYQVQVNDPEIEEDIWAFIQFNSKGKIKDSFCSCDTGADSSGCVHIATAFLKIYNDYPQPLHQRFTHSLWHRLCYIYADRLGTSKSVLKQLNPDYYYCPSASGKQVFYISVKNKASREHLDEIFRQPTQETETTSLKFSNLSAEEIKKWKEGRPSLELKYELSFWSDFAKWMMTLQEKKEPYKISFEYSPTQIPNYIHIQFGDIKLGFYISQANLPHIIPSLADVKTPLKVYNNYDESIEKITYDKAEGTLHILPKKSMNFVLNELKNGIRIGDWLYVIDDGFHALTNDLLLHPIVKGKELNQVFNENFKIIQHHIQDVVLHDNPVKVSYQLYFDDAWSLHVDSYVFEEGDLTKPLSRFFGEWAYLEGDGFYKLEDIRFDSAQLTIPYDKVADFITQNRQWLNLQEGFQTHIISIENQLTYQVDAVDRLIFETAMELAEGPIEHKDFGPWVYVKGQGFFSKKTSYLSSAVQGGTVIESFAISSFIKQNKEELKLTPRFFSVKNPIEKTGLRVDVDDKGNISITPEYDLAKEYKNSKVKFFDHFVFVPGEGFSELPTDLRLPEGFSKPVNINAKESEIFLSQTLDHLKPFIISLDKKLQKPKKIELYADEIQISEELDQEWDLMKLSYHTDLGKVSAVKLWNFASKRKRYAITKAGLLDLHEMRFSWLHHLNKDRINLKQDQVVLSTMEFLRIDAFDEIHAPTEETKEAKNAKEILRDLKELRTPDAPNLKGLNSRLRPYQEIGVNWLWFLYHHHLSGLLCDDMGLGKTHQAMALMAAITNMKKMESVQKQSHVPCHFLVICPTSVLYHWQEKLQQFLPHARVCTFHGIKRSMGDFHREYDILLTSYGIWRNDNEILSKVKFEVAVFDEIQVAKNYTSQVYSALTNVQAKSRIGLTGTPIENRLRELKSLFDIILPHYMPHEKEYRELFVKPIEKENNNKRKALLSRFIKPFVLRRKKEDVLQDLPEKIEEISHCALLPDQYKLYQQVLHQSKEMLLNELRDENNPIPYIHVFALLSQLKQICNHPAIYYKKPDEYKNFRSGKWELFQELLQEARESQQKVVIFSQYLFMLDIIKSYLQEKGIHYAEIRGATINRGEQIKKFNEDPKCEVFIGSLQAAGLGIDLTGGSVVIHYDRWWNAARENQATDRVHRIGQKRGVQVFKLVTKGTFEERIDTLIAQKGKLMEDIVGVDEQQFVKQFNRSEIIQLLQDVELNKDSVQQETE